MLKESYAEWNWKNAGGAKIFSFGTEEAVTLEALVEEVVVDTFIGM